MQNFEPSDSPTSQLVGRLSTLILILFLLCFRSAFAADIPDPTLDLLLQKGIITQEEADKAKKEAAALRTNNLPTITESSMWKPNKVLKNLELFGDVRARYETREAFSPPGGKVELDRWRAAIRFGLRGEALDNFYFGLRVDTSQNPRSPWITLGGSNPGPFGKSNTGISVGQAYFGWRWSDWLDITVGKTPNLMYTTPMVWDPDLNPEGAFERVKYTIGDADLFFNMGQFLYQDGNPAYSSAGLVSGLPQKNDSVFLLGWQGGVNYHFTKTVSAKMGASLYKYFGAQTTNTVTGANLTYVGEGGFLGPGSGTVNGAAGGNNQTGVNNLLVLEVPMEVNFKIYKFDAKFFGDIAYNLQGDERAKEAAAVYSSYIAINNGTLTPFAPQTDDRKAYQVGFSIGSSNALGLVTGATAKKHAWEFRTYWQHVEQYALDPNLLDSDFFEGRGNLEGIYFAAAYGFSDNFIGTFRYGRANRINDKLGTGGSNLDIPQVNPISHYDLLQFDLTFRF